jgi:hypothetical protein
LHKACPIKLNKLLSDNDKQFTDRLCQALGMAHRLIKGQCSRAKRRCRP